MSIVLLVAKLEVGLSLADSNPQKNYIINQKKNNNNSNNNNNHRGKYTPKRGPDHVRSLEPWPKYM